jgi:hypothetical protein
VHARRREPDAALRAFDRVAAGGSAAPAVYRALALLERAQLLEARHEEAAALQSYRAASHVFGADARTRARARQAATRLGATAPRPR